MSLRPVQTLAAAEVLGELVGLAAGAAPSPSGPLASLLQQDALQEPVRPKAVVVFVGAQQDASGAAAQLQTLTSTAGSWVQLPNAVHQVGRSELLASVAVLWRAVRPHIVGDH